MYGVRGFTFSWASDSDAYEKVWGELCSAHDPPSFSWASDSDAYEKVWVATLVDHVGEAAGLQVLSQIVQWVGQ